MSNFNFFDINRQIKMNEDALKFYHTSYEKTTNKFSILMVLLSIISIYFIQLSIYLFNEFCNLLCSFSGVIYIPSFILFIAIILYAIYYAALFIRTTEIAYLEVPEFYYKFLREEYKKQGIKDDLLDDYIKNSYLRHLESSLKHNRTAFEEKSNLFSKALENILIALFPYFTMIAIYLFNN
jgi:hypothetical protein